MELTVKNSDGRRDPILTLAVVTTLAVLMKFLVSGLIVAVNATTTITFGTIDGGIVGALLTPTLGAAVAHRYTDKRFEDKNNNGIDDAEEVPKK